LDWIPAFAGMTVRGGGIFGEGAETMMPLEGGIVRSHSVT
jgi:hypothetical protein